MMKVQSYRSKIKELLFVLVPYGSDINAALPTEIKAQVGQLVLDKEFELDPKESRVALDVKEAIDQLTENGYYINQAK